MKFRMNEWAKVYCPAYEFLEFYQHEMNKRVYTIRSIRHI